MKEEELSLIPPSENQSKNLIRKHISLFSATMMTIGNIIGTGIFITPKGVLQNSGSVGVTFLIWFFCGIISIFGAKVYLELGTSIPKSGGNYIYLKMAFGELVAFLFLWIFIVIQAPSNLAIASLTFSHYVLEPIFNNCDTPAYVINFIAILVLTFITFINCYNVHWATRVQNVFGITKILALVIIIVAGVIHFFLGNTKNFQNPFEGTMTEPGYIVLAFYSGMFTFSGWNVLNSITEEIKDPFRNMPRAIYAALTMITLIYILTNIAYLSVLTPAEIKSTNAVAVAFGNRILGTMAWIMPLFVAMSTFGSLNGSIFAAARIVYVAACEGHLPNCLSMINVNYLTPMPSLIFLCTLGLLYSSTSEVYNLITFVTFTDAFLFVLVTIGLLRMRRKEPQMYRPIKINLFFPIIFLLISLCFVIIPCYVTPWKTVIGVIITFAGIPVYYLITLWKSKLNFCSRLFVKITYFVQVLTLSVSEDEDRI